MWLTCICFGIGAIFANFISKKIFEDKEKYSRVFNFKFNEKKEEDRFQKMGGSFQNSFKKSETQRILESADADEIS